MYRTFILTLILFTGLTAIAAQNEIIDNRVVIEMSKAGLSAELIVRKISAAQATFDVSANSLIDLKRAGVDDVVIGAMIERSETVDGSTETIGLESGPTPVASLNSMISSAKTIAFGKSSVQPSRQALEKELMKRRDFQQLDLTIQRYKDSADLFVDIGFVSGSWITHRYVYRIYDRKSGAVITAGETTSWGSLAENLARHIVRSLAAARNRKT